MNNPDDDRDFRRPRAWLKVKQALGIRPGRVSGQGDDAGRALLALEEYCRRSGGCVRTSLAVAVQAYLALSEPDKGLAYHAFCQDRRRRPGRSAERLPKPERDAYAADFAIVMKKLFGKDLA